MRLLVLQHVDCEHPGVFTEVMDERGVEAATVELDRGEPLPDWRGFDAVLAMGGPMGACDDEELPWLEGERRLIGEAVDAGRGFLGVCLGVQLLAAALGAPIEKLERPEVGLLPVELTDRGRSHPLFAGVSEPLATLQWHGDTFELPQGATLLASSPAAPHQAFAVGERAFGVQFHLEVTGEMARQWAAIPAYRETAASTLGGERAEAFLEEIQSRAGDLHPAARRLFGNWLEIVGERR
ncbi:MAG: type 1 glutamine amidotransferase [Solirubrobacterales bacterium]